MNLNTSLTKKPDYDELAHKLLSNLAQDIQDKYFESIPLVNHNIYYQTLEKKPCKHKHGKKSKNYLITFQR